MSNATGQKAGRKFPPPCWTRDEALVLIEAYRERWLVLHRAFLRTPDWEVVAEKVATSCPDVTPPKTSAQCRHKMEKLRQRHRAEKQRASAFSGEQFFSTWFYFEAMEAMENGSSSEPGNKDSIISQTHLNPGRGIRFKPSVVQKIETLPEPTNYNKRRNPNLGSRVSNRFNYEDGSLVETLIEERLIPITHSRNPNSNSRNQKHGYLVDTPFIEAKNRNSEIRIKPSITIQREPVRESVRPGLRPRKYSKVVCDDDEEDEDDEMWIKVPRNVNSVKGKYENVNRNMGLNKGKVEKKNGGISEMVASIKLLGDGFLKVEKMKMDMAKEIEKMRMESEMKRNQLMLESQKQIIDAFVKGLIESRKETTTMGNL